MMRDRPSESGVGLQSMMAIQLVFVVGIILPQHGW